MSRQAQPIWRAALKRIEPELPSCAPDWNEAQYASLIFESSCMECGNDATEKDFCVRLRLCSCCWKKNIMTGYDLAKLFIAVPKAVYSLIPRIYDISNMYSDLISRYNNENHRYYRAEFEMVVEQYVTLQHEKKLLKAFIEERQQMSSDMIGHGSRLHSWDISLKAYQTKVSRERRTSIMQKLKDAGWHASYCPGSGDGVDRQKWTTLLNIPEPLTDEGWRSVYRELEPILHRTKDKQLSKQLNERALNEYTTFLRRLSPLDRGTMPHWPEARMLPSITSALSRYREDIDRTKPFWDSLFSTVSVEAKPYSISVKKALVGLLKDASPYSFPSSANLDDILNHACSIFQCLDHCYHGPVERYFNYPDILAHSTVTTLHESWSCDWVECDPGLVKIGFLMLKKLNLPPDTSRRTIENLDGKLICLCGHPDHRRPTSFYTLVNHVANENDWFDSLQKRAIAFVSSSSIALFNNHDMEGVEPVVTVVSPDMKSTAVQAISRRNLDEFFCRKRRVVGYCAACYRFSGQLISFKTEEKMRYHMMAKHHIKILGKTDFDTKENVTA